MHAHWAGHPPTPLPKEPLRAGSRHRHSRPPPGTAARPRHRAAGVPVGRTRHRQVLPGEELRRLAGPGVREPARHPARAGGPDRRPADPGRPVGVLPAGVHRPRRAVLPLPGRAERGHPGRAEGVLLADPRPPYRQLRTPQGLHRHRRRKPRHRQRTGPPHRLRAGQPPHPRPPGRLRKGLAGVGRRERHPPVDHRPPHRPPRPPVVQAAQDRGAVLHPRAPGTCSPTPCTPSDGTSTRRP
ncbi:hypothetical protein RKD44_001356 [Streptomyces collinus]